jgi:hypothetical protein
LIYLLSLNGETDLDGCEMNCGLVEESREISPGHSWPGK